jgi:beta-fructofuranosidase
MLRLPDSWVWDSWYVRDQGAYHVFFLYASRALHEPALRHRRASIGHAVSADLVHWERVADAVVRSSAPGFDQLAPWTGSIVRGDDDRWYMFYTGTALNDEGALLQQIGLATSDDLVTWHKHEANPLVRADPRWYEKIGGALEWQDEHWRDPWVMRDPSGRGWHMLITARAGTGPVDQRGVIGHATSDNLIDWTVRPPLTKPGAGFGHMEVPQVEEIDGRPVLLFNCPRSQLGSDRAAQGPGGVWVASAESLVGPYSVENATLLADERLYVGKAIQDPTGEWVFIAFANRGECGAFVGELIDPVPVGWVGDVLVVDHAASPRAVVDSTDRQHPAPAPPS